jgi:citrate/tricarballylate utilization protein
MQPLEAEGARIFRICNACRYCEGFCAVYPAMERRTSFPPGDLTYLANLCHNCGECYDACPYAPPHEFAVNVPLLLAQIRVQSYEQFAWPRWFARAYRANGVVIGLVLAGSVALSFVFSPPDFYAASGLFGVVAAFVLVALAVGLVRFWRFAGEPSIVAPGSAVIQAARDALTLRYLTSGDGRPLFHHLTFYGFLLCFASTTIAAIYHYLFHWNAPYRYLSLPVIAGAAGGVGLLAGTSGLFVLKLKRNPAIQDPRQFGMDAGFVVLLFLSSLTGLLLLGLRRSSAMPTLLAIHLGVVLALFLTLPYGKFVHGIYRASALFRNALER